MLVWAILGRFGPFWAVLCPNFGKSFFRKTRNPDFGTCISPILPPKHGFMASPKKGKSDFLKTRMPQKGTCFNLHCARLHPLKMRKAFSGKQEPTIFGLS